MIKDALMPAVAGDTPDGAIRDVGRIANGFLFSQMAGQAGEGSMDTPLRHPVADSAGFFSLGSYRKQAEGQSAENNETYHPRHARACPFW